MKAYSLAELVGLLQAQHYGDNAIFSNISIDTRTIKPGDLYIAIKGDQFDGHDFIEEAFRKGAVAAISEKPLQLKTPYLLVKNARIRLGQLANFHRQALTACIIGLTGSMGKTTTKAMLAAILQQHHKVLSPLTSMNNDIGLPLTLLQLNAAHEYAVIEMGANHFGEIAYLTQIAGPDLAMITNIGPAHLEYFGDLNGVVKAKAEIFSGLKENGKIILNRDDQYFQALVKYAKNHQIFTFGLSADAHIRAENIKLNAEGKAAFDLLFEEKKIPIQLNILGQHNVMNALAAAACAVVVGVDSADIKKGLEQMQAVPKRLIVTKGLSAATIIDDSYSAIPAAVFAALEILAHRPGKKIFVFGGMAELERGTVEQCHYEVGKKAQALGIDYLLAFDPKSKTTVTSFGENGFYFETKQELIQTLKELLDSDTTVLVKGSRGSMMEEVVANIRG